MWLRFPVEIEEHYNIKEEHHNGTCVNDNVYNSQELCIEQHIMTGDAKERDDEVKNAVNRIARHYDHDCGQYRQE